MVAKTEAVEEASENLKESTVGINTADFRTYMADLIKSGMPPAEARFYAASNLSEASYSELADAFGVTKGSISSAAGDVRETLRETRNLFIRLVDGPKLVLGHVRFGSGGFSERTHHYIVRYIGDVDARYGVLSLTYTGYYHDPQSFESFDITRYETVEDLATDYYKETLFDDIRDAYEVRSILDDEGTDDWLIEPEERLTHEARDEMLREGGMLYAKKEVTDSLSTMEGFDDGLIEYDGDYVDVYMGRQMGEYSIRDAASGAEVGYVEGEQAPDIATLYEEVGPAF